MATTDLQDYKSRAARALLLLHEQTMRDFLQTWRAAKKANVKLPETDNADYKSMETLLIHVLGACRGYMIWLCDKLGLPDPAIDEPPPVKEVQARAAAYVAHLLERWRLPLAAVEPDRLRVEFPGRWGSRHAATQLEHAVLHPMRHAFQLRELMS